MLFLVSNSQIVVFIVNYTSYRSLTDRLGEDGHNSLNNGFGLVVGWGKTQTSIDDEISIVSTATQQKVDLPLLSITKCVDKYKGIGVDLTQDIR